MPQCAHGQLHAGTRPTPTLKFATFLRANTSKKVFGICGKACVAATRSAHEDARDLIPLPPLRTRRPSQICKMPRCRAVLSDIYAAACHFEPLLSTLALPNCAQNEGDASVATVRRHMKSDHARNGFGDEIAQYGLFERPGRDDARTSRVAIMIMAIR
jgi:hypothetical protein